MRDGGADIKKISSMMEFLNTLDGSDDRSAVRAFIENKAPTMKSSSNKEEAQLATEIDNKIRAGQMYDAYWTAGEGVIAAGGLLFNILSKGKKVTEKATKSLFNDIISFGKQPLSKQSSLINEKNELIKRIGGKLKTKEMYQAISNKIGKNVKALRQKNLSKSVKENRQRLLQELEVERDALRMLIK